MTWRRLILGTGEDPLRWSGAGGGMCLDAWSVWVFQHKILGCGFGKKVRYSVFSDFSWEFHHDWGIFVNMFLNVVGTLTLANPRYGDMLDRKMVDECWLMNIDDYVLDDTKRLYLYWGWSLTEQKWDSRSWQKTGTAEGSVSNTAQGSNGIGRISFVWSSQDEQDG